MDKHQHISRLLCLLASQIMACWGCATSLPAQAMMQPSMSVEHSHHQIRDLEGPVATVPEKEVDGPDASDAASDAPEPKQDEGLQAEAAPGLSAVRAAERLQRAFDLLRRGQAQDAIAELDWVLASGALNDAGRALALWHLAAATQAVGNVAQSCEALQAFEVVASDILWARQQGEAVDIEPFVQRFDLVHRLARARTELDAAWSRRNAG